MHDGGGCFKISTKNAIYENLLGEAPSRGSKESKA